MTIHCGFRRTLALMLLMGMLVQAGCKSDQDAALSLFPPTPGEAARDAFNVYDADARRRSLAQLSAASFGGEETYLKLYRLLLDDPDPTVQAAAAKALGEHGTPADAALIIPLLSDDAAVVRWEAAKALQRVHNPAAIEPLMKAANADEDADVRMAAAKALGQYPQHAVFDVLVGALSDRDFGVVASAHESLVTLTGQELPSDSAAWLNWSRENRNRLFANQRQYTYQPYSEPPGFVDKMKFWKGDHQAKPQTPTGLSTRTPQRQSNG